jgi:hypothetical protein
MARQRNPSGGFSPSSAGIGQQIMYSPEWADIDFADFQGLNMGLINQNAQFAQEVANKRLDEVLKQRDAILEKVKLHKRFDDLQGQLDNKLASIIDNMGQLQLSDAANYTSLNTSLIKANNDPVLQGAVQASQDAMSYEKMKFEKPEIADQPWNNANEGNYQKFLRGETNDFTFNPIYKEYDLQTKADEFAKQVPPDVQTAIVKYGVYGLQEKAIEDKSAGKLLTAFNSFKQGLMQDPEFQSWYNRRGNYEKTRGSSIDDVINNMFKSSAAKFGTTAPTVKVGMPREEVDLGARIRVAEAGRDAERFAAEKNANFPSVTGKSKAEKEPDNYLDYNDSYIRKRGDKLTPKERANLMTTVLSGGKTGVPDYTIDANGKLKLAPDPIEGEADYTPTGIFRQKEIPLVGGGRGVTVLVELSNNLKGANRKVKYKPVEKEYFERSVGASEYTGAATPSTDGGNYAGLDANGDPVFKK